MDPKENRDQKLPVIRHAYIKTAGKVEFRETFRAILYHKELSKLAKLLALVLIDSPKKLNPNFSVYARKMDITPATMSKIRGELRRFRVLVDKKDIPIAPQIAVNKNQS